MKILVGFKNPKTGEVKHVKCGFSWTLFFWAGLLGLPLFLRKLNTLAIIVLVLWAMSLLVGPFGMNSKVLQVIMICTSMGFQIWLGYKGNELTAKNYLEHDWIIAEPNSEFTKIALRQWGLSLPETAIKPQTLIPENVQAQIAATPSSTVPIFFVVVITVVSVIGVLMFLGRNTKTIADNSSSVETAGTSESAKPEPQWAIRKEKDKLTDKITTEAYKLFPSDNGHIEVRAACFDEKAQIFGMVRALEGIKFEFNYFVSGDNEAKQPESSYEHELNPNNGVPFVTISYRLDSGKVNTITSSSKYKNQALLYAFTKESSEIPNLMMLASGNLVTAALTTTELANARLLRIRLPILGRQPEDIEIRLTDLHDVISSCASISKSETNVDTSSPSSQVNNREPVRNTDGSIYESTAEKLMREAKERSTQTKTPSMFGGYYEDKPVIDIAGDKIREARETSSQTNSPVQVAPSINCKSTRLTTVELLVCNSQELMNADLKLNEAYLRLIQTLDSKSSKSLKKEQKQWLANRSTVCGIKLGDIEEQESSRLLICLQGLYDRRVSELQSRLQ